MAFQLGEEPPVSLGVRHALKIVDEGDGVKGDPRDTPQTDVKEPRSVGRGSERDKTPRVDAAMILAGIAAVPGTAPAHSCGRVGDSNPDSEAKEREQLREQLLRRRKVGLNSIGAVEYESATPRV